MSESETLIDKLRIERPATTGSGRGSRAWWIVLPVLFVAALSLGTWYWLARTGPAAVETVRPEMIETGRRAATASVLDASGYVVARRQATVASEVTGKLLEVRVEEGMRVEAGQVLARLDDATEQAQMALAQSRKRAAVGALAEIQVQLEDARRTLERQREVHRRELVSQSELDRAQTAFESLQARLASQREQIDVVDKEIALQARRIEQLTVRAPFAGVVIARAAQAGEMVSPISAGGGFTRTGICTIVDMDSLEIEVDVNESYIDRVTTGQPVIARLDAYPDLDIPAEVTTVVPAADRQKATVRVRVGFVERDPRILPDMGISVRFLDPEAEPSRPAEATARPLPRVPDHALTRTNGSHYAWIVDDGRVERRAVRTGSREGRSVFIAAGLSGGELLVANAEAAGLSDGDRVRIVE